MQLTERQIRALLALGRISEGAESFLNVIDADQLVGAGLADRFGKGQFVLTDNGWQCLKLLRKHIK